MSFPFICEYFDLPASIAVVCAGSVAYGIHIAIATMTIWFAVRARNVEHLRRYCFLIAALLCFSTVNYVLSIASYINPHKYLSDYISYDPPWVTFTVLPEMMAIVVTLLCNGLLMYRCYIVWNQWKSILIVPVLLLAGTLVSAFLIIFSDVGSHSSPLSFWLMLILLNITLSTLISGRIIFIHWRLRKLVGKDLGQQLKGSAATMAALVIESSILYTVICTAGVPVFMSGWDITVQLPYTFSPLIVHTECIASELIILRVILGHAVTSQWASATTHWTSTIKHPPNIQTMHNAEIALEPMPPSHQTNAQRTPSNA